MSCHLDFFSMSIGFMSHGDFKIWPCYPVKFKGQWPQDGSPLMEWVQD